MTLGQIAGVAGVLIALLWFGLKLHVSYSSRGGAYGMVPVLDGALFPPVLGWGGLALFDASSGWPGWPWWAYFLAWSISTLLAGWAIVRVGRDK